TVQSPVVVGGGMTSNAALVSGVKPVTVAVSVYPAPGLSMVRSANRATPFTACVVTAPLRVAPLGLVPSATVIRLSAPATRVPAESTTVTWTGVRGCPARALPGPAPNTRPAGGSWDNGVSPLPLNSLSKWQLATSATIARRDRVFIAAERRCKGRTGSAAWSGLLLRLADLNRPDTPAESQQQVCSLYNRLR